ncbi:hypothetical protein ACWCQZ_29835 [Streptomyces sp. NPDC002285]
MTSILAAGLSHRNGVASQDDGAMGRWAKVASTISSAGASLQAGGRVEDRTRGRRVSDVGVEEGSVVVLVRPALADPSDLDKFGARDVGHPRMRRPCRFPRELLNGPRPAVREEPVRIVGMTGVLVERGDSRVRRRPFATAQQTLDPLDRTGAFPQARLRHRGGEQLCRKSMNAIPVPCLAESAARPLA